MSKKRVAGISLICMMAIICVLVFAFVHNTFALFTDTETAINTVTMGNNTITVEEEIINGEKQNVGVTNNGTVPCYVRALVTIPTLEGAAYTTIPESPAGWTAGGDGYWYYNGILKANETATLYDSIQVNKTDESKLTDAEFIACGNVIIYAESVQSSNLELGNLEKESAEAAMAAFELLKSEG